MKRLEMYSKRKWYGYSGASVGRWVITVAIGIGIGVLAYTMSWGIEVRSSVRPSVLTPLQLGPLCCLVLTSAH